MSQDGIFRKTTTNDSMLVHRQKAGFKENCTKKGHTTAALGPDGPPYSEERGGKRKTVEKDGDTEGEGWAATGFPSSPSGHQRKHDSNRRHKSLGRARRAGPCLLHLRGENKVNCPTCSSGGSLPAPHALTSWTLGLKSKTPPCKGTAPRTPEKCPRK